MLKPGTIVGGKYRLRHLIAEGGMSEVYLGEALIDSGLVNRHVALKRLLPLLAKNAAVSQMFMEEAALASLLDHKNIVRAFEFIKDKNNLFMVMEFIVGKEIGWLLPSIHALPLVFRTQVVMLIGLGVCEALSYLHNRIDNQGKPADLVHGDLSPQNIMVSAQGEIKIYDFGAAHFCVSPPFNWDGVVRGNLRYMSPEQRTCKEVTAQSDIYSLCKVLLELLTKDSCQKSRTFFNGDCYHIEKLGQVFINSFINSKVESFFAMGLDPDPKNRFASARHLEQSLRNLFTFFGPFDKEALKIRLIDLQYSD